MRFVSVKDAYLLWHLIARVRIITLFIMVPLVVLKLVWVVLPVVGIWLYLGRLSGLYRSLFWFQALTLHSSRREGEPEIYEFMSRRDRGEHARRSLRYLIEKSRREP